MFPRFSSKSDENHASPMENLARHQKLFFHNFPKPRATSAMNDAVVRRSYRSLILTTSQQQQYCWPDWKCLFLAYNQVFYSLIFSFLEKKIDGFCKAIMWFYEFKENIYFENCLQCTTDCKYTIYLHVLVVLHIVVLGSTNKWWPRQ